MARSGSTPSIRGLLAASKQVDVKFCSQSHGKSSGTNMWGTAQEPYDTLQTAIDQIGEDEHHVIYVDENELSTAQNINTGDATSYKSATLIFPSAYTAGYYAGIGTLTIGDNWELNIDSAFVTAVAETVGCTWGVVHWKGCMLPDTCGTTIVDYTMESCLMSETGWAAFGAGGVYRRGYAFDALTGTGLMLVSGKIVAAGLSTHKPANNTNSDSIELLANSGGTTQTGGFAVAYGADPYIVISPPNGSGTKTDALHINDTLMNPATPDVYDLGSSGNKFKDLYLKGNITVDGTVDGIDIANHKHNGIGTNGVNIEGTDIISTGETGAVKFLREDGDGTCSWQSPEYYKVWEKSLAESTNATLVFSNKITKAFTTPRAGDYKVSFSSEVSHGDSGKGTRVRLGLGLFAITVVNQGSKIFTVVGDYTTLFIADRILQIQGSTGNDGTYHVLSSALNGGNTEITVVEAIPDSTADGDIYACVRVLVETIDKIENDVDYQEVSGFGIFTLPNAMSKNIYICFASDTDAKTAYIRGAYVIMEEVI